MSSQVIFLNEIPISNQYPFVLFGGINVLESRDLALKSVEIYLETVQALKIPYVFKASFDKANRSSLKSFRGPGMDKGLKILEEIKKSFQIAVLTDIHEPYQAQPVSEVADIIQIPAFLCRQTDLIIAAAKTQAILHIKKGQFLAPEDMKHILVKCEEVGNKKIILCERGSCFGYHNLIVDFLGFPIMKSFRYPVSFDVTHSLQFPGGLGNAAGGRGQYTMDLAMAGISQGLAALFLEVHPNPKEAKCDGPSALPIQQLKNFLIRIKALDELVKNF